MKKPGHSNQWPDFFTPRGGEILDLTTAAENSHHSDSAKQDREIGFWSRSDLRRRRSRFTNFNSINTGQGICCTTLRNAKHKRSNDKEGEFHSHHINRVVVWREEGGGEGIQSLGDKWSRRGTTDDARAIRIPFQK